MGSRERHEATNNKAHSTAVLLQERFKELQRKKQMREERQLLKFLNPSNVNTHESSSSFVNNHPSSLRSPPHVSLTLWPPSEDKSEFHHTRFGTSSSSANMSNNSEASWNNVYDCGSDSGVDTSLHL